MGSRTGSDCTSERYQPFRFYSNESSDCVYLKSLCSEIGQTIYECRSTEEDSTCSCDSIKGYGFVTQPRNIEYCTPSKEDCSCYLVQCADNNTLSPDYKCRPSLIQTNENYSAENTHTRDIKPSISDEDDGMVVDCRCIIIILTICYIVIASIIVITIDYCLPNKCCCTDDKRQEMPPIRDRIISNFSSLIRDLDSETVFPDLLKHDLVTEQEVQKERNNQPNKQNRFILIKLIANCGELDKEIERILYKQTSIHQILRGPISARRWPKRVKNVVKCRHRPPTNRKLVEKEPKKPQHLFDDFLEIGVFDICNLTRRKKMAECFMDKVLTSVENGSYDLLLPILKREMCNVSHDYQTIVDALEKTPNQSVPEKSVCINLKCGKLYKSNEGNTPRTVLATPLNLVVKTGDHLLQLLHVNKAFLQEEIDPLTLLEGFSKRGFYHFKEANIEIIPDRKLRTANFLDILEKESDQLMDVFIEILEDQKMNIVLKRLKLYQKMQLIDAALLRKNITKDIASIVDEVDLLEDIKDEIISRYSSHGDKLEELYSQYPEGSDERIVDMLVDILGLGDSVVFMFIDILFIRGIDSSILEPLSAIEQVSDVDDNAFEVMREVPKRGLIFQCEVEVIVEVKVTGQTCNLTPDRVDREKDKRIETTKRLSESQDFFMENTWTDVAEKQKARKRHRTALSNCSQISTETEELPPPEEHDDSDIESDREFDTMSRSDWFGGESSSSDDDIDLEDYANVDQYEKSLRLFEEGSDDEIDEHELLQNGIYLSNRFIDIHKKQIHTKNHFTYPPFYSKEKNTELCKRNPLKYKKCTVKIESSHEAVCTNLDHSDDVHEIEISERSKIGKVFNEDEVFVEVLQDEREIYKDKNFIPRLQKTLDLSKMSLKVYGQIRGIIRRHHYQDVDHPVFVCVLDESKFHLMLPVSKTLPKLYILNKNCTNKYQVDVYKYVEEKGKLQHKNLFDIKPGEIKNYIFLVAMISWENLYPLGAVLKVINAKDGFNSGMEILRLHHQVPSGYKRETMEDVRRLLEYGKPVLNKEGRLDLTNLEVFTIDPSNSRDLDNALSIEKTPDGNFRVGVHIADVTSFIKKGDYVDVEAYERATTFYPGQGRNPYHMLPEPMSTNLCSLITGERRPAISILYTVDEDGKSLEKPEIKRSTIKSRQQLTYSEAQDVLLDLGRNIPESICKQIKTLFRIAKNRRRSRLGGALYYYPVDNDGDNDDFQKTKEAHYLVEEFMILANHTVGTYLFRTFKDCIPLRIQQPPEPDFVQQWLHSNRFFADLILKLQEIQPLPWIESERKLSVSNALTGRYNKVLMFQQYVWKNLMEAVKRKQSAVVMQILGCDENHPFSCLGLEEWYEFQEMAEYKCSGEAKSRRDGSHFSLGMFPYIHFTSPIRRYVDIISHRQLHCALDGKKSCYTSEEVSEMCHYINEMTQRAKVYQKKCLTLTWGYRLRSESMVFHTFVKTVSEKEVMVIIPGHRNLPKESKTLQLNCLGSTKRPVFKIDTCTGRDILELHWKKRLYSYKGYSPIKTHRQESKCYRVNPHNRGFFQQQQKWKKMIEVIVDEKTPQGKIKRVEKIMYNTDLGHPETNLDEYIPECFKTERDVSSEVRKGTITLQSCEYSMTFNPGQILSLQMSAESVKGVLIPQIEIFDMTNNIKYCLLHAKDPIKYLEKYSTSSTKDSYFRAVDYIRTWKPLVEMEAATNAVAGDTATINDVPVKFLSEREGKFSLRTAFCDQRNLEINKVPLEVFLSPTVDHNDEEDEGPRIREIASPDYLCIKCPIYKPEVENTGNQMGYICAPQDYKIWLGHAKIDRVKRKKEKSEIEFIFKLNKNSQPVPLDFLKGETKPRCSVEIIFKSSADGHIDALLQCLDKANPLAKAIALGSKIPELDKGHFEIGRKLEPDILNIIGIVKNNPKQYNAIQKALASSFHLIQGPPGTGKTYTGIKLVYLFNKINLQWQELGHEKKQIIFCGPSNKSVDLVAKWMKKKLGEHCPKMVRWYGSSIEDHEFPIPGKMSSLGHGERAVADVELREVSMHILIRQLGKPCQEEITTFDRQFRQHPDDVDYKDVKKYRKIISKAVIEEVKYYDVIFCTTAMATNLKVMKGTNGRIFQIIIDECGMSTEPDSMSAIIATRSQQVVLIGDHKQLRPIVMCSEAAKLGLEKSLFERYAYKATMLTSQYRMNPEICEFPSKQFYKNKLETMPSHTWLTDHPLRSWVHPGIPVVFCHVEGTEDYLPFNTDEGNEQSCSNKQEVDQVVKVFKHLVEDELINPHYINIMSQYNSQCHCIREELKKDKFIQFNVNTVVASQGGEWDYVVLSLVRSLPGYRIEPKPTLGWCKQNLGFITDEHQTNVALTRARKGLIVVGNQKLLKCNEVWANFLDHYGRRGCVVDCNKYPPRSSACYSKKVKKKSRRVLEMDERFYRDTDQDRNLDPDERPEYFEMCSA